MPTDGFRLHAPSNNTTRYTQPTPSSCSPRPDDTCLRSRRRAIGRAPGDFSSGRREMEPFFGPVVMVLIIWAIASKGRGWLSGLNAAFFVVLGLTILGRWVEQRLRGRHHADRPSRDDRAVPTVHGGFADCCSGGLADCQSDRQLRNELIQRSSA